MRVISIRQLQRGLFKELKDLPVLVTRRDPKTHVISKAFVVMPYEGEDIVVDDSQIADTPASPPTPMTETPLKDEEGKVMAYKYEPQVAGFIPKEEMEYRGAPIIKDDEDVAEEPITATGTEENPIKYLDEEKLPIENKMDEYFPMEVSEEEVKEQVKSIWGNDIDTKPKTDTDEIMQKGWSPDKLFKFFGKKTS